MIVCRNCGCQASQAQADALTLGLQQELQRGVYTRCQVVAWADEQWLAWVQAAEEDGQPVDEVTKLLEYVEAETISLPTHLLDAGRHEPIEENFFFGSSARGFEMIHKDLTSQLCWKSVTLLCLFLVLLTAVIWFAHTRLSVDNNPSTHIFVPKNNR